jgi:DNA-binding PucR family transcriptional regulator
VPEHIARIAALLLEDGERLAREMDDAIFEASPVLAGDATIEAETRASVRANLARWLRAVATRPEQVPRGGTPPEVLDLARTMVRRAIELEALMTAYRQGQNTAWRRWMQVAVREVPPDELGAVLDRSAELMFGFVDGVIEDLWDQLEREREDLLGAGSERRMETVRLILEGAPIDQDRASRRLGYELGRRHTALVLWTEPAGPEQGALERAVSALALAAGAHRPIALPAGSATLWAWLGTDAEPDAAALRRAMDHVDADVRVAVGRTRAGMEGFRRSHAAALATQRLVAPTGERLTTFDEVEVVALVARDPEQAAEFVTSVLGPLAASDPACTRLRETLRAYLEEGGHGPRAARRLNTHRNTVLQRVHRAEEILGYSVDERRLALSLALELAHRLGPRALRDAA